MRIAPFDWQEKSQLQRVISDDPLLSLALLQRPFSIKDGGHEHDDDAARDPKRSVACAALRGGILDQQQGQRRSTDGAAGAGRRWQGAYGGHTSE